AVAKGLYGLLRHEPVYADLRRLDERNARVERIAAMLEAGRDNAERAARRAGALASPPLGWPPLAADLDRWREVANAYAASEPLSDYPGYVVLKARRAADLVAELACQALDYPYDARQAYFVRQLLRAWFERREQALAPPVYVEDRAEIGYRGRHAMAAQLRLLGAFDIPFRLRRLRFLVRGLRAPYQGADTACRAALDAFKTALARSVFAYETKLADQDRVREAFARILGPDFDERIDAAIQAVQTDPEPLLDRHDAAIRAIYQDLADDFTRLGEAQNRMLVEAIQALPDGVRGAVAKDFVVFPFLDLIAFPLMDSAGLQDLIVVQTMRIAPQDAKRLSGDPKRLKGRELGAFAGFLRRAARENDLVWGRLDGADRLVDLIVRAAAVDESRLPGLEAIKARFKTQVMRVILVEEAARPGTSIRALAEELGRRLGEAGREGVPVA
ncbi:MAG: DUF3376 domain-containing protein, partial [Rhodospirillaceae bacterium]|nr:DUF3376 domain-containing protein [Rhodospirillaceae bacterium]